MIKITSCMATEADFKKVELEVSVICCDGCKKKVKKALYSIEGVLKIEIDPLQPKVSIFGNVDPQILIKRLHKAGKQAQIWIQDTNNQINYSSPKGKKKVDDQISLVQPLRSICKTSFSSIVKKEEISSDKSNQYCHNNNGDDHQHINKLANTLQNQHLHYLSYHCMVTSPDHSEHHHCHPPAGVPVPVPSEAASQVGDFFSEDNTMGCYLM